MKIFTFIFILLVCSGFAQVKPVHKWKSDGAVKDFVVWGNEIYAATNAGIIIVYNIKTKSKVKELKVPVIKDFKGNDLKPTILSVDVCAETGEIFCVCNGLNGFSDVYVFRNEKPVSVISAKTDKLNIGKIKVRNKNEIYIGLLGNELILYRITDKKKIFAVQPSNAVFSDFVLNENNTIIVTGDEGGLITLLDAGTGKIIKKLENKVLDNIFQIDLKNGKIITGSRDRRVAVYGGNNYNFEYDIRTPFFVYSVALNKNASVAAYQQTENGIIAVFDTRTQKELALLTGHTSTITRICFLSETEIASSSANGEVFLWKIK